MECSFPCRGLWRRADLQKAAKNNLSIDRKLDFLVAELRRYGIAITAIQEPKWFESDVWRADGYTFLHSGRRLPNCDGPARRNEGVGIMLNPGMTEAWRRAGEQWTAVSSRLVVARGRSKFPRGGGGTSSAWRMAEKE